MEFMKANRKFKIDEDDAVSAVIGVILMVAITVAIAATVYVYVSGMIGTSPQSAPELQLVKNDVQGKLTIAKADPGNLEWGDFTIVPDSTVTNLTLNAGGNKYYYETGTGWSTGFSDTEVNAGDYFNLTGTGSIAIRHEATNTLLGSWDFN
jgi:FlaG/FlaF family flagellin (archaellin)